MKMTESEKAAVGVMEGKVALTADQSAEIFKKPTQLPPRKKKKVLDEETYVKKVEKIIERDFFPDLENLRERVEFLAARDSNDLVKLRELYARQARAEGSVMDSPATFETPQTQSSGSTTPRQDSSSNIGNKTSQDSQNSGKDHTISLDEFMSTHTSEDNDSFEQLMEESQARFRRKYAWMFEAEEQHNKEYLPNLDVPSLTQKETTLAICHTTTTSTSESATANSDPRPGHLDNWKFNTFNSVMFVPDGIFPPQDKEKECKVELTNTRFHGNPFTETMSVAAMLEASAVQASKKEGKVGVDGKELGKDSPRVNGYNFVSAPSPAPGVDASPLMTWGEVEGTPCQLDGSQTPLIRRHTPGPSYRIPQQPNRDRLGYRLAEEASQKHRNKKTRAINMTRNSLGTPGGKTGRQERNLGMSPAAQKLLTARIGVKHTDNALRASYTPSPSTRHTPTTPHPITPLLHTPSTSYHTPSRIVTPKTRTIQKAGGGGENEGTGGLTDNLLKLPRRTAIDNSSNKNNPNNEEDPDNKRQCASDFF
ncbi:hypothetical protein Pmani_009514 [Petrolisthes manimaculis]|uniref:DGCR14 n=1 Tax=Petrolisthes manimaculis TaxID=1843537 RepID=A0AAE1Q4T3_9EUCA|nr:hypothetical protein Pmani_009514 [Petrolisthes manimaculis]